jgi:prepilin-type N-terminal cleavage/methylation domain-containing protein
MIMKQKKDQLRHVATSKKKQGGFTLLELLITVTVIAIAASFVIPKGMQMLNETTADTESSRASSTVLALKDRLNTTQEFIGTSHDNQFLIDSGVLASGYKYNKTTGRIINNFGGDFVFNGVDDDGFTLEEKKVPSNVCSYFISSFKSGKLTIDTYAINGGGAQQMSTSTADSIATQCTTAAGAADTVDILFTRNPA